MVSLNPKDYTLITGNHEIDSTFGHCTNLASSLLDARIVACSNEFFASASNLLSPTPPIHRPGVFVDTGAWYDGWETRRHNPGEYDWVVIALGVHSGVVEGIEIDTAYFVGNYGEQVLVEGFHNNHSHPVEEHLLGHPDFAAWKTILSRHDCGPSQRRAWKLPALTKPITHVRLRMYPDGGFARVRLYGYIVPPAIAPELLVDSLEELSSALLGGQSLCASDEHFTPSSNILLSGRGVNMGDGWETRRSRGANHVDWAIIKLGLAGSASKIIIDTKDFKGNYPQRIHVHGLKQNSADDEEEPTTPDDARWVEIVRDFKCAPDAIHEIADGLIKSHPGQIFTHVKLTLVPDGGIKRFRVFGKRA